MMKNLKFYFVCVMLIITLSAFAYDIEIDGFYYNINVTDKTASLTYGDKKYEGEIIIPSSIEYANQNLPVISIGEDAFIGCSKLTSVEIPNSVSTIGDSCFRGCELLKSVELPETLEIIEQHTFYNCESLTYIKIPSTVKSIDAWAFEGCKMLHKVIISSLESWCNISLPEYGPMYYGADLFLNDEKIIDLEIPNSITEILGKSFAGCTSIESVKISDSVTKIGYSSFSKCVNLSSVSLPNTLTEIGESAFSGCTNLQTIKIPDSVNKSLNGTFKGCKKLESIKIGNSVPKLESTFYGCSSLKSVRIPNSVESLDGSIFDECNELIELILEDGESTLNLKNIGNWPISLKDTSLKILYYGRQTSGKNSIFNESLDYKQIGLGKYVTNGKILNCDEYDSLEVINCYAIEPPSMNEFTNVQYANIIVNIPKGSLSNYQEHNIWGKFWNLREIDYGSLEINIKLNMESVEMEKDDYIQLTPIISPDIEGFNQIIWSSSNEDIAIVSQEGIVTSVSIGECSIKATSVFDPNKSAECNIIVKSNEVFPEDILLNIESVELNIGETFQLEATVLPEDTTDKTITWTSSNTDVATVSENGLVSAMSIGETLITATCGEVSAECKITVLNPVIYPEEIILNIEEAQLLVGDVLQLEATIIPDDITDDTLLWNSSNEEVASVSEEGLVLAISAGEAIISATCGDVSAECTITVLEDAGIENIFANPDSTISIYSIDGILIKKDCKVEDINTLSKGLYIIKAENKSYKIAL